MNVTPQQLLDSIDRLLELPAAAAAAFINTDACPRIFEAYVLSCLTNAIRNVGGTAIIFGRNTGERPSLVIFRASNGKLGSDHVDFAYIGCELQGKSFELHQSVQYTGSSNATHEVDVSVCETEVAVQHRRELTLDHPTQTSLLGAIECKLFDKADLGTGLGRAFIGLLQDFPVVGISSFVTNRTHEELKLYLSHNNRTKPFFDISPLDQDSESQFIQAIGQAFLDWANTH